MELKTVENKYRPAPFWSWNDKLTADETARQVELMSKAGMGGFFMHARSGLKTEYLGTEWFDNVDSAVNEAQRKKMYAWAYDENGWPSGFGSGEINARGIKYQQKFLRVESGEKFTETTIANIDGLHFYYDVNPYYVDTLDYDVTKEFISLVYEPYYEKYKNQIIGFFTDEPQISRNGIPWSFNMPSEYKEMYDEDLITVLRCLFEPIGDYKNVRIRFWKMVTDMFSRNFMKQIYDWCTERGLALTGHLLMEETLQSQLTTNGSVMPHYEYFTIPGMDWLGMATKDCLTQRQVSSVAQQLGKKQVLSEIYAACGHNVSFDDMRRIYEYQMVRGINLLCQHLEGYTLSGLRKRDYPPALNYQQPWWNEYKHFNDAMARIGKLLTEGEEVCDCLVIHPQTEAWTLFDNGENKGLTELNAEFLSCIRNLERKHVMFNLGDETIIERHGRVEGNKFIVGQKSYSTVVVPSQTYFLDKTKELLNEFKENGGYITDADGVDKNNITDNENVTYMHRHHRDFDAHYFVNSTSEKQKLSVTRGGKMLDITTGEVKQFCGKHTLSPSDSLIVIDDGITQADTETVDNTDILSLDGKWRIIKNDLNILTLDRCDYYFDDELIEKNGFVINILTRACERRKPLRIRMEYKVNAEYIPPEMYLVTETPEIFEIKINDKTVTKTDAGYHIDKSFRKIPVDKYFRKGQNLIVLETDFIQSDKVYDSIEKSKHCESEMNKLTYDMEIENIYLVGDFGVMTNDKVEELPRELERVNGNFKIVKLPNEITLRNIERQGFMFFAGSISLEKRITADCTNKKIVLNKKGINYTEFSINEKYAGAVMWQPTELDVSNFLVEGENTVSVTITNNLRNMLGPHHCEKEPNFIGPYCFYKEGRLNSKVLNDNWNDKYTFAQTGIL